jgi:protein sidekick
MPQPPLGLAVTNIGPMSALVQFEPGFDGYSSITTWTVQVQRTNVSEWTTVFALSDPQATTVTVPNLTPFVFYRVRLVAENAAGKSEPSEPTHWFQTLQAVPSSPPRGVSVRALNQTALLIRWMVGALLFGFTV